MTLSIFKAPGRRLALNLSICGLLAMVAAVSAVSAKDPDGVALRVGMIMMTVGAAMFLPRLAIVPAALIFWLVPNYVRSLMEDSELFSSSMLLELPGLIALALFATLVRTLLNRI